MRSIYFVITVLFLVGGMQARSQSIPKWKIEQVQEYFTKGTDTVYVINFWATFCKPCVAEIPYLQSISKKYEQQKVKLLLVSLDLPDFYPAKIASFAEKNSISADIIWLDETNADHFCPAIDKKWSGAIPATIFINNKTGYRKFFEEEMKAENFETELLKAIGQ